MKRREGMSSVLDGVRVIDFGQYIAGPLTAMLLADQGAEIIRVEPPGGSLWDTPANATWNRGKRSITLHPSRSRRIMLRLASCGQHRYGAAGVRPRWERAAARSTAV